MTKEQKLNELLQAFRLYAHDEFGENVSDYMIQKFLVKVMHEEYLSQPRTGRRVDDAIKAAAIVTEDIIKLQSEELKKRNNELIEEAALSAQECSMLKEELTQKDIVLDRYIHTANQLKAHTEKQFKEIRELSLKLKAHKPFTACPQCGGALI